MFFKETFLGIMILDGVILIQLFVASDYVLNNQPEPVRVNPVVGDESHDQETSNEMICKGQGSGHEW